MKNKFCVQSCREIYEDHLKLIEFSAGHAKPGFHEDRTAYCGLGEDIICHICDNFRDWTGCCEYALRACSNIFLINYCAERKERKF